MTNSIREFDHLMCGVKDIVETGDTFTRLGFVVGPVTPLEGIGVVNRRVLLTPTVSRCANYIEFMQLSGASGEPPGYLKKWLAGSLNGREGIGSMIMRADDARQTYRDFLARHNKQPEAGFKPILLELEFEQRGPHDENYRVEFRNCIFPDLEPPLYVSTSEIRSLEFYLNEHWRKHKNGARSWVGTIAVSENPRCTANELRAIWDGTVDETTDGCVVAMPGELPLRIFTPGAFEATYGVKADSHREVPTYLAGCHLSVEDLNNTNQFFTDAGIDAIRFDGYTVLPPNLSHGILLCFEENVTR